MEKKGNITFQSVAEKPFTTASLNEKGKVRISPAEQEEKASLGQEWHSGDRPQLRQPATSDMDNQLHITERPCMFITVTYSKTQASSLFKLY